MIGTSTYETDKKVIVIGLDGATWDLMKHWAEKGILPTFKKLMENGVYGNLESTIPPVTIPAWISFATGKNPGKLGCYDFLLPKKTLDDAKPITSKDIREKTFYEILYETGKKCILINLPGSYPPKIKETVITSIMTQGDDYIFPPELKDEIPELKNYRITADMSLRYDRKIEKYSNDVRKLEKNRFECAKKLFKKDWDFFFLLFSATDWIQHLIYEELISIETINENLDSVGIYKDIDRYIKWFLDNVKGVNVLIMSDHGFGTYEKVFNVNSWLVKEGYLKVKNEPKPETPRNIDELEIEKIKANRVNIKVPGALSNHLGLIKLLSPLYIKLKKVFPLEVQTTFQPIMSDSIAYSMTHAASNFAGIYINDKGRFANGKVDIIDYETLREGILVKLMQLKDPDTLDRIISNCWKKEDIYSGSKLNISPDVIFELRDKYIINRGFGINPFTCKTVDKNLGPKSNHVLQGIFLAHGPDIKKGVEIQNAKIIDLTPTILHLFGMPIPEDMDGKVLKEIFKEDSELAKREIKYQKTGKKENVKGKIKELKSAGKI